MNATRSGATAKVSHRLAMHLRADRFHIARTFGGAQTNNRWLIFHSHDVADEPSRYGCTPALMNHALEAASHRQIPVLNMAEALLCAGA